MSLYTSIKDVVGIETGFGETKFRLSFPFQISRSR